MMVTTLTIDPTDSTDSGVLARRIWEAVFRYVDGINSKHLQDWLVDYKLLEEYLYRYHGEIFSEEKPLTLWWAIHKKSGYTDLRDYHTFSFVAESNNFTIVIEKTKITIATQE